MNKSIPRNYTTIEWLRKMINDYVNMKDCCDGKCNMMTVEELLPTPFHMIHFLHPFRFTVHGYVDEKRRMSDIMIRCNHHRKEFNNNPQKFISFIMNILYKPILKSKTNYPMHYKINGVLADIFDDIFDLTANGICQICIHYLATELPAFLMKLHEYAIKPDYCIEMICNLLLLILQYPSLAICYMKHKNLWKYIMYYFGNFCILNKYYQETNNSEDLKYSYRNLSIFGHQILRNGILMKKSKYWKYSMHTFIKYIISAFKVQCKRKEIMDYASTSMLNVYWMIELYVYYIRKNNGKLDKEFEKFLDDLIPILHDINKNVSNSDCNVYNNILVKELISHLFEICYQNEQIWLITAQKTVWKMKRNNMKCLWYKCDIKAKECNKYRLSKCKKCRVARYCSKRCQKLDWNLGHHKNLCYKLYKL